MTLRQKEPEAAEASRSWAMRPTMRMEEPLSRRLEQRDGELVISDHGYGGSVLARGQGERALGDSIRASRGDGLINKVTLEQDTIEILHECLLCVGLDIELGGPELGSNTRDSFAIGEDEALELGTGYVLFHDHGGRMLGFAVGNGCFGIIDREAVWQLPELCCA